MTASANPESVTQRMGLHVTPLARWSVAVIVLNLAVIAWGAVVRATGSGAGCGSHWPLCDGAVLPPSPRMETLIELTHRATSGLAALAVLALAWAVFRAGHGAHAARRPVVASVVFMILEALLGAGLVLFGWVEDDASWGRVVVLGLHLVNTFLLLAALVLTSWRLSGGPFNRWRRAGVEGGLVWSLLGLVVLVGVTGAMTSLGDTLFPAASLAEGVRQDFAPTSHFLVRLRVLHPMLAVLTAVAVVRGAWLLVRRAPDPTVSMLAKAVTGIVLAQIGVGLTNLILRAPTAMQILHLFVADVLWMSLVLFGAATLAVAQRRNAAATNQPAPELQ